MCFCTSVMTSGIALVPVPVQLLCHRSKLDDKVAREVHWLGVAALFAP